jgi:zinc transport system substrate-binding protein
MRRLLLLVFILNLACSPQKTSEKEILTVSILPQKYFVEKITGGQFEVQVLVPPGANHENYSLLPSQMKSLSRSLAWFRIGKLSFEEAWQAKIKQSNPNLKIVDTSASADWIAGTEEQHGDHVHLHGIDPHIWMGPDEVLKIAEHTAQALSVLFPDKKELFAENLASFKKEIETLDGEIRDKLAGLSNRKFLIFHPALSYFARQYDLEQISLEVEGKEPSPKHMAQIITQAREEGIKVVFIQKEFDQENARQLASEIEGKVVQIDPMNEDWAGQLREIADKIIEASK